MSHRRRRPAGSPISGPTALLAVGMRCFWVAHCGFFPTLSGSVTPRSFCDWRRGAVPAGSTSGVFSNRSRCRLKLDVTVVLFASPLPALAQRRVLVCQAAMMCAVLPNDGGKELPFCAGAIAVDVGCGDRHEVGRVVSTKQGKHWPRSRSACLYGRSSGLGGRGLVDAGVECGAVRARSTKAVSRRLPRLYHR